MYCSFYPLMIKLPCFVLESHNENADSDDQEAKLIKIIWIFKTYKNRKNCRF